MDDDSFAMFFLEWADLKGWDVPPFHVAICDWLDEGHPLGLLQVFRGAAKSTIVAVYEAYRLYRNPQWRFLDWAADDNLATKLTRDVREVLTRHPRCLGLLSNKPAEHQFWVNGSDDQRNASVSAYGILSNTVGSRADEIVHDDVEVPKNVGSPDLREKLRGKISDGVYILVPGGRRLFVGTPHTHDSIYLDIEAQGASVLRMPLFKYNYRQEGAGIESAELDFVPFIVYHGKDALREGVDYRMRGKRLELAKPLSGVLDVYGGNIWPERFTWDECRQRRAGVHSLNEWDSQYMLRAKPINDTKLNPDHLIAYDAQPVFTPVNDTVRCTIGFARMVGVSAYWDVAKGNEANCDSVVSVVYEDAHGNKYWHESLGLVGELDDQIEQLIPLIKRNSLPALAVETNGIGGFVPAYARKKLGHLCAILEHNEPVKKTKRIIGAIEPLLSAQHLYAHVSLWDTPAIDQMQEFGSGKVDYIDSLAGAILQQPVRIRGAQRVENKQFGRMTETYTAEVDYDYQH